jgi:peptidyl-prolyl cis-trans isomerase B (cyclophilin B)
MTGLLSILLFVSAIVPSKQWYASDQPVQLTVEAPSAVRLVLVDFVGRMVEPQGESLVQAGQTVNLRDLYPARAGGFLLFAVPQGKQFPEFVGTPLVVNFVMDPRPAAPPGPMAIRVRPLEYVRLETDAGDLVAGLYYDVAPNTVANFLSLARGGFYDGLSFSRIIPGTLVQTGDPRGDLTGGPGYSIAAEFNERPHVAGVMSMSRLVDPIERQGALPRSEYANSAGSQFFVAVDEDRSRQLDRRYTAFGRVVEGLDVLAKIAAAELADVELGRPANPVRIKSVRVLPVTPEANPYDRLFSAGNAPPTTQPQAATEPFRQLQERLANTKEQ